tara:strand:+ start:4762 stop:5703 length:942 start_codon:yes stop_codon:yes gene_type:complete
MIQLFTHTYHPWQARKRQENGAATYSTDLLKKSIPALLTSLEKEYPVSENILISTCPLLQDIRLQDINFTKTDIAIQYLHTYPYEAALGYIQRIWELMPGKHPGTRLVLITAYRNYSQLINSWAEKNDIRLMAVYLPMQIDREALQSIEIPSIRIQSSMIYFGNLYKEKSREFLRLKSELSKRGILLDVISRSRLNGSSEVMTQQQIWELLAQYRYGIGVGRCALEMYALGMQVLISGQYWGGLLIDSRDEIQQMQTNFNGRIITGTRDFDVAMQLLPDSYIPNHDEHKTWYHSIFITTAIDSLELTTNEPIS